MRHYDGDPGEAYPHDGGWDHADDPRSHGQGGRAAHRDRNSHSYSFSSAELDRSHRSDAISARRGISLSSAASQRVSPARAADPHRSMSGNPLHTVQIAEDADVELDRDEMRRLVASVREGEEAIFDVEHMRMFHDGSTLGTTPSALRAMGESEHGAGGSVRPRVEIDGAPGEFVFLPKLY